MIILLIFHKKKIRKLEIYLELEVITGIMVYTIPTLHTFSDMKLS